MFNCNFISPVPRPILKRERVGANAFIWIVDRAIVPGILRQSPCFFTSCRFSLEKVKCSWCWFTLSKQKGVDKNPFETWHTLLYCSQKKNTQESSIVQPSILPFVHPHCDYFRISTVFKRESRAQKNLLFIAGAEPTFTTTIWIAGIRIITFARTPLVMFWLCPARKSNIWLQYWLVMTDPFEYCEIPLWCTM